MEQSQKLKEGCQKKLRKCKNKMEFLKCCIRKKMYRILTSLAVRKSLFGHSKGQPEILNNCIGRRGQCELISKVD